MFLSCHLYRSEWTHTLCCMNVNELLARNRHDIWNLSDCKRIRTHNHLVCKRTLNHLAQLIKWLSWVVITYLYGAFECIFLSCHVRISGRIHTLCLPECQETPFSKQARHLKFKLLQGDSNSQPLSLWTNTQHFGQTDQMIDVSCEYFQCFWLCSYHVTYAIQRKSTLYLLPECQGTPFSKQAWYLKFNGLQWDSNPQALSS